MTILDRLTNFIYDHAIDPLADYLFGPAIEQRVNARLAAVSARVDDSSGWTSLSAGPADQPWSDHVQDMDDALEAWRKSFFARRIVTLARSYVVGSGIMISSADPTINQFVRSFWSHRKNHITTRLGPMCDELTRAGELFPTLHTNPIDGMSYVRFVPARLISHVHTADNDYETELSYDELTTGEPKVWIGIDHPRAFKPSPVRRRLQPLMVHYAVNRPIGATRGEGDLGPVLPWIKRYTEWLKDRVRLNRQRTRQSILDIEIADDSLVEDKRQQLRTHNPVESGIYVHGPGEKTEAKSLNIRAADAKEDGHILRLAVATGANLGLHYLGEGENVNYATAKEMGEPTARFYSERQDDFTGFLCDLVTVAYRRYCAVHDLSSPLARGTEGGLDLQLIVSVTEIARADNAGLATAAKDVVEALSSMRAQGWIDDPTAIKLAFKFAGEVIDEEQIQRILAQPPANDDSQKPEAEDRE